MSAATLTLPPEQAVWRPRVNPWAIAVTVSMAAFIEVLDTSVANVALPYIAGGLGASYDDSTWVLTSYLAANAIVLPISGWLAELMGRKQYFMTSLAIFTISSLLCGLAPNLPLLLLFRAVQGIGGGGLQPMAQAILNDTFPPEKRGSAFALYGISAVLAPTVGPMLGGWITDNYSWRWIFFITLPPVLTALYLTHILVEDPPFLRRLKKGLIRVDYMGMSMLALGVGSLQVVLDK
jgi:DHA2 family multidrug resistance protein